MSYLLDANALIALGWPAHEHHERMIRWFKSHARQGWSTCALTQGAFLRVICQPAFAGRLVEVGEVAELLARNTAHPRHQFLPLDFGFEEVLGHCTGGVRGHRQITDAWLLTLAARNGVKLLTFDTAISQLLATVVERERYLSVPA
ncbi:TA system VapC family ribonuclease toxin [Variovorax rhizosphaerae]|uniref:Ribonuclease VapC n=1 Tax=Variovorax rhizosphaerae TaxID=1836200 RepID=A0ABU8WGJ8_9BURK